MEKKQTRNNQNDHHIESECPWDAQSTEVQQDQRLLNIIEEEQQSYSTGKEEANRDDQNDHHIESEHPQDAQSTEVKQDQRLLNIIEEEEKVI